MSLPLASVDNALRLLLELQDGRPLRVTDAAALLGVSRATAHRLLASLEHRHFVEQDPATRAYLVGAALARNWVPQSTDILAIAEPALRAISRELGESAHLSMLNGTTITVVGAVGNRRAQRNMTFVGTTFPAHFSAAGQALLADLPLEELRRRYTGETLRQTAWTRTTLLDASDAVLWKNLLSELKVVRERDYATNFNSGGNRGVNAIACSLHLDSSTASYALVIPTASALTGRRRLLSYAAPLRAAAMQLRAQLSRSPARSEGTSK